MPTDTSIYQRPAELLQNLIRFDTTNPPGNEADCAAYIRRLLTSAGIETSLQAMDAKRPNVIARLKGEGKVPPFLMYGHMDVVTTIDQIWEHPPFEGKIVDGFVWGRGALDMKSGMAMMLSALLRMKAEGLTPPGDVIFAAVCDEEGGGDYGAKFLVEKHADLFKGVRYAIGEFGGFNLEISGRKLYPIQIAEKQICWMKATLRGPSGHGSMIHRGGTMAKLARFLRTLDENMLPIHITPAARVMFTKMAAGLPFPSNMLIRMLTNPGTANTVLNLLGERGSLFAPLLRNTVNPTMIRGGEKENVIPGKIEVTLDGRLLPGFVPDDMFAELRALLGNDVDLELVKHDPGPAEPNMGMFSTLADILCEQDSAAIPVPLVMSGVTDARFFCQLGIQTYGFTPLQIPQDMAFTKVIHAANERVPVEGVNFGTNAVFKLLQRFHD